MVTSLKSSGSTGWPSLSFSATELEMRIIYSKIKSPINITLSIHLHFGHLQWQQAMAKTKPLNNLVAEE